MMDAAGGGRPTHAADAVMAAAAAVASAAVSSAGGGASASGGASVSGSASAGARRRGAALSLGSLMLKVWLNARSSLALLSPPEWLIFRATCRDARALSTDDWLCQLFRHFNLHESGMAAGLASQPEHARPPNRELFAFARSKCVLLRFVRDVEAAVATASGGPVVIAGGFALHLLCMREAASHEAHPPLGWAPGDIDIFVQTDVARAAVEACLPALQQNLNGTTTLLLHKGSGPVDGGARQDCTRAEFMETLKRFISRQVAQMLNADAPAQLHAPKMYSVCLPRGRVGSRQAACTPLAPSDFCSCRSSAAPIAT